MPTIAIAFAVELSATRLMRIFVRTFARGCLVSRPGLTGVPGRTTLSMATNIPRLAVAQSQSFHLHNVRFALSVDVIVAECVRFESVSCPNLLNMRTATVLSRNRLESRIQLNFCIMHGRQKAGASMRLDGQRIAGRRRLLAANWLVIAIVGMSSPAMAYLDPGATYIAIQGLLGLVAGSWAAVIVYRRRIVDAFRRWSGRTDAGRDLTGTMLEVPRPEADMSQNKDAENRPALP